MRWKDWFQASGVREYAMIGAAVGLSGAGLWVLHLIVHFLDSKPFTQQQFFELTKEQLQGLIFSNYALLFGIILIVVALTLTHFSVKTRLGEFSVGKDDDNDEPHS